MSPLSIVKLLFVAGMLMLAAISARAVSISDVLSDPRTYVNKTVAIEGTVTGVFSLVVFKYFTVRHGAGAINVITEQPLPKKGQQIRVVGKVKEGFSLGENTLLVLIEEEQPTAPPDQSKPAPVERIQTLPGSI